MQVMNGSCLRLLMSRGSAVKFVVPVYESDSRLRPSLLGSGFFVRAGERHFLISAGHVLETLKARQLFYDVSPGITRKLSGRLLLNSWQGYCENDPIDVGVLWLSDEELPPYPEIDKFAIDVSYLCPALLPRSGRNYIMVGFPASRSEVNPVAREVAATAYGYRSPSIEDSAYSEQGHEHRQRIWCCRWTLKSALTQAETTATFQGPRE